MLGVGEGRPGTVTGRGGRLPPTPGTLLGTDRGGRAPPTLVTLVGTDKGGRLLVRPPTPGRPLRPRELAAAVAAGSREATFDVRLAGRPIGRPGTCGSASGSAMGVAAMKAA